MRQMEDFKQNLFSDISLCQLAFKNMWLNWIQEKKKSLEKNES